MYTSYSTTLNFENICIDDNNIFPYSVNIDYKFSVLTVQTNFDVIQYCSIYDIAEF